MLSAAILAGGRATRFGGADKSALLIDGRTILDRQLAELSALTDDILLVGGAAANSRVRAVADLVSDCGPLGGLYTALAEARGEPTLVVACDMPYLSAPLLAHLAGLAAEADAVVPRTADGLHPLCAAYSRACLPAVARRLAERRLKMADLVADLRTSFVGPEQLARFGRPERLLANLNTPGEYRSVAALHAHGR